MKTHLFRILIFIIVLWAWYKLLTYFIHFLINLYRSSKVKNNTPNDSKDCNIPNFSNNKNATEYEFNPSKPSQVSLEGYTAESAQKINTSHINIHNQDSINTVNYPLRKTTTGMFTNNM
jgi:cytoskeletal protein RodZ